MTAKTSEDVEALIVQLHNKGEFVKTYLNTEGMVRYHLCTLADGGSFRKVAKLEDNVVRLLEKHRLLHPVKLLDKKQAQRASVRVII